jgi:hypothetical protein
MVIWQQTDVFAQHNDLTILFISHRLQRCHNLNNHWPLSACNGVFHVYLVVGCEVRDAQYKDSPVVLIHTVLSQTRL